MGARLLRRSVIGLSSLAVGCLVAAGCGGGRAQPPIRTVVVPHLAGVSSQAAVHRLCALGLRPDAVKVTNTPPVRSAGSHRTAGIVVVPMWIVGTDPAAGARVPVGSTVTIRFGAPANISVAIWSRC
jgi:beta-lactam-binding protein with PASTA domain